MTTAKRIAQIWNASRNVELTANEAFENVINASFGEPRSLAAMSYVNLHHREIHYADGSILTVLDQSAAYAAGITSAPYAFKSQDQLA